jgi:hypothetical protein
MSTKKEYKAIKNFIHNEAGINKELIKEFAEQYLETSIDRMIADKLDSKWMEGLIVRKIGEIITGQKDYSNPIWGSGQSKAVDYIKSTIKETVKEEVVKRITFDKIEVS